MHLSRNSTVIKETKDVKISFDGKIARLVISSCTTEYSGSYKIVVKNEFGSNESEATLTVQGWLYGGIIGRHCFKS